MDKRVIWLKNMQVGHPILDLEHKSFIDIVNESYVLLAQKKLPDFHVVFLKIEAYIQMHFPKEEQIMQKIAFPDFDSHQESHKQFASNISELKKNFLSASVEGEKEKIAHHTADYIKAWFLGHTLSRDKIYKPYLVRLTDK